MKTLKQIFDDELKNRSIKKIVFSSKRKKSQEVNKINVRPVKMKNFTGYQAEFFYEKKVTHENIDSKELPDRCVYYVENCFRQVNIFDGDREVQILASKPDKPRFTENRKNNKATESRKNGNSNSLNEQCRCSDDDTAHNKKKNYIIPDGEPCDFLIKLGVMSEEGKVYNKYYSKFRQINRFLEIVDDTYGSLIGGNEETPLRIIDFGCGKAYLTFAVYYYMRILKNRPVEIIGLDLKKDVIDFCSNVSEELGYESLKFLCGDIADYTSDRADMVITLHACDTATDFALINAVKWGAQVILSVPCCQHEMFRQIDNELMKPMLKHGIIKDKFTELLTDGLRGLKLESNGYNVSMIEFTSLEHTSKNIMIKAVRNRKPNKEKCRRAENEYEALKSSYSVSPSIDIL